MRSDLSHGQNLHAEREALRAMDAEETRNGDPYGDAVVRARAAERDARIRAERAEREAVQAAKEWTRCKLQRERAELWKRAEDLRAELADVESRAASIAMPNEERARLQREARS